MRTPLLLLLLLSAAPVRAQSVCYFNSRDKVVDLIKPYCNTGTMVFYSVSANYDISCGIANTFNYFGKLCQDPCKSALKGIVNYPATKGKIVVFGPSLLPLGGNNSKWAFAEYSGSCGELRASLTGGKRSELSPITDDDLIKAGADPK